MHCDTLADPLDERTKVFKKVSGKRTKTISDYEEIGRLEYAAGLYVDHNGSPVLPGRNVAKSLTEGARMTKSGMKIERGLTLIDFTCRLGFKWPRKDSDGYPVGATAEVLCEDSNFVSRQTVKVGQARNVRVRPIFRSWRLSCHFLSDETVVDVDELVDIADRAGRFVGLGDFRRGGYGRFWARVVDLGPVVVEGISAADWDQD
jgi:hypothetical protein